MKNIFLTPIVFFLIVASTLHAQDYFEGLVKYKLEYEILSKDLPKIDETNKKDEFFTVFMKEDRVAMVYYDKLLKGYSKIIVRLDQGYVYIENENSPKISRSRFNLKKQKLLKLNRNPDDKKEILGATCESVTLNYQSANPEVANEAFYGKHYYDPRYKLNPKFYERYTDRFLNLLVGETKALSVRSEVVYYPHYKTIQEAVLIEEKKMPFEVFEPNLAKPIKDMP